jgi:hypothetical protein
MRIARLSIVFVTIALLGASAAEARMCAPGKTSQTATVLSVAHAGLGEWYIKGWGSLSKAPQNKFWLGFIPIYGWPYLAIRSAIDSSRCQTLDRAY